jgi:hypothetical protein
LDTSTHLELAGLRIKVNEMKSDMRIMVDEVSYEHITGAVALLVGMFNKFSTSMSSLRET